MIATLGVRDLRVDSVFGVYEEERLQPRQLLFEIEFDYEIDDVVKADDIRNGVDYDRVVNLVREHAVYQKYRTLEALVSGVITILSEAYPFLHRLRVEIRKPGSVAGAKETWTSVELTGDS